MSPSLDKRFKDAGGEPERVDHSPLLALASTPAVANAVPVLPTNTLPALVILMASVTAV